MSKPMKRRFPMRVVKREGISTLVVGVAESEANERELWLDEMVDLTSEDHLEDLVAENFSYFNKGTVALANMVGALNMEESGDGGVDYQSGVNQHRDDKFNYLPFNARGLRTDLGLFHQAFLDEVGIYRPFSDIRDALRLGDWYIEAPDEDREDRAAQLERHLFDVQGGWKAFVENACYMLLSGFVLFEEVFSAGEMSEEGDLISPPTIEKLAFRYPNQVLEWVLDQENRDLVAVKFARSGVSGQDYFLPASALLLININAFGNDFEGISPLRSIIKFHLAKDMLTRLEALAGEKFGVPIFVLSQSDNEKAADEDETDYFTQIYNQLAAEDMALIELPDGKTFTLISPQGSMPNFTEAKRYCDEQISLALQGEGNLIGMQGNGSLALAEVADNRSMRSAPSYADRICEAINGARGTPHQGTLRKLERLLFGEPDDGQWCKLRFSLDRNGRDSNWFTQVATAKTAGLVTWEAEDEEELRQELGLRKRLTPSGGGT